LHQDGKTLVQKIVTASAGNGERGTFDVELPYDATGPATIVTYDRSAADGSVENRVEVPVTLG
ncbi:MAG: Gmad2 immunoglobulin-like domain-containing protein, partial [Gaiellaceae bacterium]